MRTGIGQRRQHGALDLSNRAGRPGRAIDIAAAATARANDRAVHTRHQRDRLGVAAVHAQNVGLNNHDIVCGFWVDF